MIEAKREIPPESLALPDKFRKMLASANFRKALRAAATHTAKTGYETIFNVLSLPGSGYWIDEVRVGGTESTEASSFLKEIDGVAEYDLQATNYFSFHFHPGGNCLAIPSAKDIAYYGTGPLSTCAEYMGVGEVYQDGKIDIFVVAKPRFKVIGWDIRDYHALSDYVKNYEELTKLLSSIGLTGFSIKTQMS